LTDLLELDAEYLDNTWSVFTHPEPAAGEVGEYHLLLQWESGLSRLPLLLYHSELDQVEELPFYHAQPFALAIPGGFYGFSPDGQWVLLGEPAPEGGAGYWLRPVDPVGTLAARFGQALGTFQDLSPQAHQAVFYNQRFLQIVSFPAGELLSKWETPGYYLNGVSWSPDGTRLAAWGQNLESGTDGLFFLFLGD
jgi:hypothetical protein